MMRVLFVMDPLDHLDPRWDTSLCLLEEFARRCHRSWTADTLDIRYEKKRVLANARQISPSSSQTYRLSEPASYPLTRFDLILIRKEPPFDLNYLYLTYLLELVSGKVPVVNHPRGIRNANEKLAALHFPGWNPETLVTSSVDQVLAFQDRLKEDMVLKPLNQKGGKDILLVKYQNKGGIAKKMLLQATKNNREFILAQRFIQHKRVRGDKRILILNGEILTAFEKRPPQGDFRSNLSLGGTAHPTKLTSKEKKLAQEMKPYLLQEGLLLVGLDVMAERLIEINVTCASGIVDAKALYPELALVEAWADSLEALAQT